MTAEAVRRSNEVRASVDRFAEDMKRKMFENIHKPGWTTEELSWLLFRLQEELDELQQEMAAGRRPTMIRNEAADVANIAMMIADAYEFQYTGADSNGGESAAETDGESGSGLRVLDRDVDKGTEQIR